MTPEQAVASFQVPSGFRVQVFAAEPDVQNPIAMAWDSRGRLWIAENYTYAERPLKFEVKYRDRVLIFEDTDGDGRSDRRKVFTDDVQMLTSVEVGRDGVWLVCPPQLLFVPDRNHDDIPDGAAEVVLDGFYVPAENYHNFANGLRWGPDGWLYGRCGASCPGRIGPPGTPDKARVPLNGGLWRYHPKTKHFEVLAHGTTNPWGHDWNSLGEAFFINTVNGHLWYAFAGAHLVRPHTIDPNPRVYESIDLHADHWHFQVEKGWQDSRNAAGEHGRLGGGHAHIGAMIYLGDQWPDSDRDKLFTWNMHGRRINVDRLERSGSGYVGRHDPDRFFVGDLWFRGIDLTYGPDGSVYTIDWSDTGECHEANGVHRHSGRIYKLSYGPPRRVEFKDLATLSARELAALPNHSNEWFVRMARTQLADRAARGERLDEPAQELRDLLARSDDPVLKLRALWSLHVLGADDPALLRSLLDEKHEAVRGWAIRLLTDAMPLDTIFSDRLGPEPALPADLLSEFARMAAEDRSGLVRLILASTLQRLPVAQRAELAGPLLRREEDSDDHNIPLLIWYGLIPVAPVDPSALAKLGASCALSPTRRLIARRLAEDIESRPEPLNDLLRQVEASDSSAFQADILRGVSEGLLGWRQARKPASWDELARRLEGSKNVDVRDRVRELSVIFGDGRALDEVKRLALDELADLEARRAALRTLIESRPPDLRSICERLLRVRFLNTTAVRGLSQFDDPALGRSLARSYRSFHPSERSAVIDTLVSRPAFAGALLDQMAAGAIPRTDVTPFHARQIRSAGDAALNRKLAEVWGDLRDSAQDKQDTITHLKARLTPETLAHADRSQGRVVFNQVCATCHKLYGYGGEIGPDLTGSGRDQLDYLLENMIDPSATVTADYRMMVVGLKDGRVLNGVIKAKTDRTLTLQTQTEAIALPRSDIERIDPSPSSLMPEGLLSPLSEAQVRDLFAYLVQRTQAPLPPALHTK
jgi:putative membrane-bound dehydrogenase-like protein